MGNERSNSSGGAAVAVIVIVILLGFFGLVAVGGLGLLFYARASQSAQMEAAVLRAEQSLSETRLAEVRTREAAAIAELATAQVALPPTEPAAVAAAELLLAIDGSGQFTLEGKPLTYEELKEALLTAHFEKGPALQLAITAAPETPFKRVSQAMECAECASITKVRVSSTTLQPSNAAPAEASK